MGGARIRAFAPPGYRSVPVDRNWTDRLFTPPENIFAVLLPQVQTWDVERDAHGRGIIIISARPEFMDEEADPDFFQAMCRDFIRVNGIWGPSSLESFRRLGGYYQDLTGFAHNLGVFHATPHSLSMARIIYEADKPPDPLKAVDGPQDTRAWAADYFTGGRHRILTQNIIFLNRRCFNIYFIAPLAGEDDISALLDANRKYMDLLAAAGLPGTLFPPEDPES